MMHSKSLLLVKVEMEKPLNLILAARRLEDLNSKETLLLTTTRMTLYPKNKTVLNMEQ